MEKENIQILIETSLRCGGNCSGCALTSLERMSQVEINWELLEYKFKKVFQYLNFKKEEEIEAISIFLGQGDHFLLKEEEMILFMEKCSYLVPKHLIHKTVVLMTASAIGKRKTIQEKMDLLYELSLKHQIPFFIQVVFDPKKIKVNDKFEKIYIQNILYFKEKCGMTELTINLGNDLIDNMSPKEFHQWVKKYQFKHVELNWVVNKQTKDMWIQYSEKMLNWLKNFLEINALEHEYEINFIPFLSRALLYKEIEMHNLFHKIQKDFMNNIYIDYYGNLLLSQVGLVSNLIPLKERTLLFTKKNYEEKSIQEEIEQKLKKQSLHLMQNIYKNAVCLDCEFKNVCAQIGSYAWLSVEQNQKDCFWKIKDFLQYIEQYLEKYPLYKNTRFDKNPIQHILLKKENNELFDYFEKKF